MKAQTPLLALLALLLTAFAQEKPFRPPAVPLVACDPYFSIWSNADRLTDDATRHWTKAPHRLASQIQIDGQLLRVMGDEPTEAPALDQVSLKVLPTRTIYDFEGKGVHLTLTFLTAALPEDLMLVSRPVTYLTWDARSVDGAPHAVSIGYENGSEPVINIASQVVEWSEPQVPGLSVARVGTKDQPVLAKSGDNLRIDWGYLYTAVPKAAGTEMNMKPRFTVRFDLGKVAAKPVSRWLMLAYDDEYSIQFFGQNLRPYWRRDGADAGSLLRLAAQDYPKLQQRCQAFDTELMADLTRAGGEKYARMCALAYRQCFAANKIAADSNRPAAALPQGEHQQRVHRHGGRDLSHGAAIPAVQSFAYQGDAGSHSELRRIAAMDVSVCSARSGQVPAGQRAGVRRRREDREEPDAGRGNRQHADPGRRASADRRERRFRRPPLARPRQNGPNI